MAIYIAGPDGKPVGFTSEQEALTHRHALREAEPAWLRRLRQRHKDVIDLLELAQRALAQRRGRSAAISDMECRLRGLCNAIADDIQAAKRDAVKGDQ